MKQFGHRTERWVYLKKDDEWIAGHDENKLVFTD